MTDFGQHVLVSIPHAGLFCPKEVSSEALSEHQQILAVNNVDWHTNWLYDFRDILGNNQVVFPYSQVFLNVNRHPQYLDEAVPLELDGLPIYKVGQEPAEKVRRLLLSKYHNSYHRSIALQKKAFILDGHSTVTGHEDATGNVVSDDIIVSDFQSSALDPPGGIYTAPKGYLETYCEELERRLEGTGIRVVNNTTYTSTYGHVMATHGWDGRTPLKKRAPLLLQETNEQLYIRNGLIDVYNLGELRRIFSHSLVAMLERMETS